MDIADKKLYQWIIKNPDKICVGYYSITDADKSCRHCKLQNYCGRNGNRQIRVLEAKRLLYGIQLELF